MLTATALGAIISPLLLGPSATLAATLHLPGLAGLYLLAAATYTLAALLLRRPQTATTVQEHSAPRAALSSIDRRRAFGAVGVLAAANLLMVGVMSVAPVHLAHHGTSRATIGVVVAAHVAAMFAPSPLTGRLADRAGSAPTALLGLAVLAVTGIASVLLDTTDLVHTTVALLLLGLGWNLGLVGGSAMLVGAASTHARPRLEAIGEIAMGAGAAVSAPLAATALSSGLNTVWLLEAVLAALAATALAAYHATRLRPATTSQ